MVCSTPTWPRPELRVAVALLAMLLVGCERPRSSDALSEVLPGAAPRDPRLAERLRDAAADDVAADQPRTRHRRADGTARYTNRLVLEGSPYLRQHAHNPVDWYPWGDEAFARAKREDKLILLSVGYATCHWCHVMEEESFEDEEIARHMNADYVAIKVDREERPDVDGTYLEAVALLTGGAGWPMTVWMTPDREVFFAGTYFPPRDGDRGARTGFLSLLRHFAARSRTDRARIVADGRALTARMQAAAVVQPAADLPGRTVLDAAFARYAAAFDHEHGGFGRAPKFPMPAGLEFLLRYHRRTKDPAAVMMVERTLAALAEGGVRDQLGGGFHRYATDAGWRIPHFEKMLYDNAQLATVYLVAWQVTGRPEWRDVARAILDDLLRTFRAPEGAFHAAIDADDPRGEGAYYTWTAAEVAAVLPDSQAVAVRGRYGIEVEGNLEGRSVPWIAATWSEVGSLVGLDPAAVAHLVADGRDRLLAAREKRPAPLVDTKILTGWNGLAITALARAGAILAEPRYVHAARDAAAFIVAHLWPESGLLRVHAAGRAGQPAFLEDHAFLAVGLLDLFEATADVHWLDAARRLHQVLAREFWDAEHGAYFETGRERDARLPRTKPADDGAIPSGNAVAAELLVRLAVMDDDDTMRVRAGQALRALGKGLLAHPTSAPRLLGVVEAMLDRPREIVIVEPVAGGAETAKLLQVVHGRYLPNRALVVTREGDPLAAMQRALSFVGEKHAIDGRSTAYVCERGRCLQPTSDSEILGHQLDAVTPLPGARANGD